MKIEKTYSIEDKHIDVQGILDGLYYPFYMEYCRHDYLKEVLGFDLAHEASQGVNIVLTQYTIRFKRSLKKGDTITVTCEAHPDTEGFPVFHLVQEIRREGKLVTEGIFTATFVKAAGGRSYLPDEIVSKIQASSPHSVPK
jgi:acyl-CoA thioester hydrolase